MKKLILITILLFIGVQNCAAESCYEKCKKKGLTWAGAEMRGGIEYCTCS